MTRTRAQARTSASSNKMRKTTKHANTSTHSMRTRTRARIFRFRDLPAEIRHFVYARAYSSEAATPLANLRLPTSIKVPTIFTEALPFFFENNPTVIDVRSNWCVRYAHRHNAGHERWSDTGMVHLPKMISQGIVKEHLVRFRDVQFELSCCCCDQGKVIARMSVEVANFAGGLLSAQLMDAELVPGPAQNNEKIKASLEMIFDSAKTMLAVISSQEGFNGLKVFDLQRLAMLCRDTTKDDGEHDSNGE